MTRIQARFGELQLQKVARVRDQVMAMITSEGLDYGELMGHARATRKKRSKVKPKYRNPKNPTEVWSGRGRQPRWSSPALEASKKKKH